MSSDPLDHVVEPEFPSEEVERWLELNGLLDDWKVISAEDFDEFDSHDFPNADFVAIIGRNLFSVLGSAEGHDLGDQFEDLCASHGFDVSLSLDRKVGFYYDPEQGAPSSGSYLQKLRDPRWKRKAQAVRDRAGHKCQDCGASDALEAHHCWYRFELEPWEYPLDAFRCVCSDCHKRRHIAEHRLRTSFSRFSSSELGVISEALERIATRYDRTVPLEALRSI